jgi:hypothetical protein
MGIHNKLQIQSAQLHLHLSHLADALIQSDLQTIKGNYLHLIQVGAGVCVQGDGDVYI